MAKIREEKSQIIITDNNGWQVALSRQEARELVDYLGFLTHPLTEIFYEMGRRHDRDRRE
jgi:hypothetical protein